MSGTLYPRDILKEIAVLSEEPAEITLLLKAWGKGDQSALDRLTPLVYDHLRRMARHFMANEQPGNTLQATALVNEAYTRLVDVTTVDWQDRAHFFAICARLMRRILVDAARSRASSKRGGYEQRISPKTTFDLDQLPGFDPARNEEVLAVHESLEALSRWDPRKAQVVELRFFGDMSVQEISEVLKISPQSVKRDWKLGRAWLTRELRRKQ